MNPEISRRQAWMKLAVLIADGLPEPKEIDFHVDGASIFVQVDIETAFTAWTEALELHQYPPTASNGGDRWIRSASTTGSGHTWHGWYLSLTAYTPRDPEPGSTEDDLIIVRALADGEAADLAELVDSATEDEREAYAEKELSNDRNPEAHGFGRWLLARRGETSALDESTPDGA